MKLLKYFGTPVTALLIHKNNMFAGCGGSLKVFQDLSGSQKCVKTIHLFKHCVIHGISAFETANDSYLIIFGGKSLKLLKLNKDLEEVYCFAASDWILDCVMTDFRSLPHLAIALAHNSCLLLDWKNNKTIFDVSCPIKCILYCAHFMKDTKLPLWENLKFFAGTVFNQVVVWTPGGKKGTEVYPQSIDGHDGVIFDIFYCPKMKIMLTASDDRSVRLWKCPFLENAINKPWWNLCKLYAHEARIWKVRTIEYDFKHYVISVAEDGLCILWKIIAEQTHSYQVAIVKKLKLRGNLLSFSLNPAGNFAIGCSSGNIYHYSIKDLVQGHEELCVESVNQEKFGIPKIVKLLKTHPPSVLLHTDKGYLLCNEVSTSKWTLLHHNPQYSSYSTLALNCNGNAVAIGNTKGNVTILTLDKTCAVVLETDEVHVDDRKIQSLSWNQHCLFVSDSKGNLFWFEIKQNQASKRCQFVLPKSKHRWHTDVLILEDRVSTILCGDRRGTITLYLEGQPQPFFTNFGVHGKNGVTSLFKLGDVIVSTGRDGFWRKWVVSGNQVKMLTKHRAAQGMEWLEKCDAGCHDNSGLVIYGFHGKRFVVWSQYSGNELFSVECGGCHRSWDFSKNISQLVYLKESQPHVMQINHLQDNLIEPGLHKHQTNCVKVLACFVKHSATVSIIATASEDTKVIISLFTIDSPHNYENKILHTIDDHTSSVRSLCFITNLDNEITKEVILFSAGGRGTLCAHCVRINKLVTKDSIQVAFISKFGGSNHNAATRFMDVTTRNADGHHEVAVACSDGRILKLKLEEDSFDILGASEPLRNCYLVTSYLRDLIVSGATDGFLYFVTSSLQPVHRIKTHQSGINCLHHCDVTINHVTYCCLATGGDDNSIRVMTLLVDQDQVEEISNCVVQDSHSAQVTGLYCTAQDLSIQIVSASIDQRVTTWNLKLCEHTGKIETFSKEQTLYTHIADVSTIDVTDRYCVIGGRGLAFVSKLEGFST